MFWVFGILFSTHLNRCIFTKLNGLFVICISLFCLLLKFLLCKLNIKSFSRLKKFHLPFNYSFVVSGSKFFPISCVSLLSVFPFTFTENLYILEVRVILPFVCTFSMSSYGHRKVVNLIKTNHYKVTPLQSPHTWSR